jgi:hypothetical protein
MQEGRGAVYVLKRREQRMWSGVEKGVVEAGIWGGAFGFFSAAQPPGGRSHLFKREALLVGWGWG